MKPLAELLPQELNYAGSPEMTSIQNALTAAAQDVWDARDGFAAQLSPATATWGLDAWEAALGLVPPDRTGLDARRRAVIAKLRGAGTSTVERIASVAEAQLGGEGWVVEHAGEYRVEIWARSMAAPDGSFEALTRLLKEIMPAHLRWSYGLEYPAVTSTLYLGGSFGSTAALPIPKEETGFHFKETLRTGGAGAIITTIPIPEGD